MIAIFKNVFNHPFVAIAKNEEDARKYIDQNFSEFIGGRWYKPRKDAFIFKPIEIWEPNPNDMKEYWD